MNYARSTDRKGYFIHLLNLSSQAPKQWMEAFEQLKDDLQVEPWIKEVGSFSDLQEKLIERHQIDGQFLYSMKVIFQMK
ncbi:MAG: hypothetical protein HWD61_08585 [Parachlamydiaceae bacterium]|nr:MAG: hypothetical protein HWD61_08585 [Parachlamydiaceae bacterium]